MRSKTESTAGVHRQPRKKQRPFGKAKRIEAIKKEAVERKAGEQKDRHSGWLIKLFLSLKNGSLFPLASEGKKPRYLAGKVLRNDIVMKIGYLTVCQSFL